MLSITFVASHLYHGLGCFSCKRTRGVNFTKTMCYGAWEWHLMGSQSFQMDNLGTGKTGSRFRGSWGKGVGLNTNSGKCRFCLNTNTATGQRQQSNLHRPMIRSEVTLKVMVPEGRTSGLEGIYFSRSNLLSSVWQITWFLGIGSDITLIYILGQFVRPQTSFPFDFWGPFSIRV